MAYEPQPFVATQSGAAGDAPRGARPIALYGVEGGGGGGGVELPINISDIVATNPEDGSVVPFEEAFIESINPVIEMIDDKADDFVTLYIQDPFLEGSYIDDTRRVSEWLGFLYGLIVPDTDPGDDGPNA